MKAIGTVERLDGKYAFVRCDRTSACSACHECASRGSCHAELIFGEQKSVVTVKAKNNANAAVGDKVELESSTSFTLMSAFSVFVMPVLLSTVFYFLTKQYLSAYNVYPLIITAFFVVSFCIIAKLVNLFVSKNHTVYIVRITEESIKNLEAE